MSEESEAREPVSRIINTICDFAERAHVSEILFESQRVDAPTEVEGVPAPIKPAGSIVFFVFYRVADELQRQLSFAQEMEAPLLAQLRRTQRPAWRIDIAATDLGHRATLSRAV